MFIYSKYYVRLYCADKIRRAMPRKYIIHHQSPNVKTLLNAVMVMNLPYL